MPDIPAAAAAAALDRIRERQALAANADLGIARLEERHDALIKVAYEDVPVLLAVVEAVLALVAKHEYGALRWEDPLPVPSWIPQLRAAVAQELLGEAAESPAGEPLTGALGGASPGVQAGAGIAACPQPGVRWLSTYALMMLSGAPPHDAAK